MSTLRFRPFIAVAATAVAALTLGACGSTGSTGGATPSTADVTAPGRGQLTVDEVAGIQWMREEEKLARDVYTTLGRQWDLPIFTNIAASEQTHMDAVAGLIESHGLTDPAATTAAGEFTNPAIQELHDTLVAQGSASESAALTVGASIEDLDLADLAARATDTPDVAAVYANLERGSRNHLRAFSRQLEQVGGSYAPTHITQAEYDAIVGTGVERGRGRGA